MASVTGPAPCFARILPNSISLALESSSMRGSPDGCLQSLHYSRLGAPDWPTDVMHVLDMQIDQVAEGSVVLLWLNADRQALIDTALCLECPFLGILLSDEGAGGIPAFLRT